MISDHEAKANVLFEAYISRLGILGDSKVFFDHDTILQNTQDLSILEAPFMEDEINSVIASLPNGKTPGLDGFNTYFLTKC